MVDDLHPSTITDIKKNCRIRRRDNSSRRRKRSDKGCKQLGKEPKFVTSPSGIKSRYTDKETAEILQW